MPWISFTELVWILQTRRRVMGANGRDILALTRSDTGATVCETSSSFTRTNGTSVVVVDPPQYLNDCPISMGNSTTVLLHFVYDAID